MCPSCHPFCASLSGLSHAPLPQLLRGSPETRAYCVAEAHRGLGAGWSVCVNILQSLRKPPTLAPLGPPKLCVCQGQDGDLQSACLGMTAGERVGGAEVGCRALGEDSAIHKDHRGGI